MGRKPPQQNKARHGDNFYAEIGRKGGIRSSTGGFADLKVGKDGLTGWQRAKIAGRKGGLVSKRGKAKKTTKGIEDV